jgi:hypothetical protein
MGIGSRAGVRAWLVALLGILCVSACVAAGVAVLAGSERFAAGESQGPAAPVGGPVNDDAGDDRATTTYDGPMVRRRVAIAVHPVEGADRDLIRTQLRAAADREKSAPLTDATFAVFSAELLRYLVPEIVVVLPEGATLEDAEVLIKDYRYPTIAFHLVESVLVHDLTFAVVPSAVRAAEVSERVDREGILSDSLGHYATEVQRAGLVVRYFGALLSDGQVLAVRESLARAAQVAADRVLVEPSSGGAGVDMSREPDQTERTHRHE